MQRRHEIERAIEARAAAGDAGYAVAYGLLQLADMVGGVAGALRMLGTANAATPMGAVEFLAVSIKEGLDQVAKAVERAGDEQATNTGYVADAVKEHVISTGYISDALSKRP